MKMGDKIAKKRKELRWSQNELAEKIFVSDKTVSKWETNRGKPEIGMLKKLASVLGMTVDELLDEDEPGQEPQESEKTSSVSEVLSSPILPKTYNKNNIRTVWILSVFVYGFLMLISDFWFANISGYFPAGIVFLQIAVTGLLILSLKKADTDLRYFLGYLGVSLLISIYSLFTSSASFVGFLIFLVSTTINVLLVLAILGVFKNGKVIHLGQLIFLGLTGIVVLTSVASSSLYQEIPTGFNIPGIHYQDIYFYQILQSVNALIFGVGFLYIIKALIPNETII